MVWLWVIGGVVVLGAVFVAGMGYGTMKERDAAAERMRLARRYRPPPD